MISNESLNLSLYDFQAGQSILIDKPFRWSSFKVIHEIRKLINTRKVGHAGTLDPNATGLLILCTGKKTKEISKYQDLQKTYTGIITLGKSSPSMDTETEILEEKSFEHLTANEIHSVKEKFIGEILQIPPMFSAVKHKGKSLYQIARKGKTVKREPRKINIYSFNINKISLPEIHFEIVCSKGTYIRAIANDLGNELGCGGLLSSLRRTKIGEYSVNKALTVDEFKAKMLKN